VLLFLRYDRNVAVLAASATAAPHFRHHNGACVVRVMRIGSLIVTVGRAGRSSWHLTLLFNVTTTTIRRRHQPQKAQKPDDTSVVFDFFYPNVDICYDEASGEFGTCDSTRFPTCSDGELICYNRRPFRNRFYADTRQPLFYIDYKSVLCYPNSWQGCSSCSPGRYCKSEQRCILQDVDYPCEKWF
jgi:hypothetical protein